MGSQAGCIGVDVWGRAGGGSLVLDVRRAEALLTTHYSLLTTHYSLLTTHYLLLTTCLVLDVRRAETVAAGEAAERGVEAEGLRQTHDLEHVVRPRVPPRGQALLQLAPP